MTNLGEQAHTWVFLGRGISCQGREKLSSILRTVSNCYKLKKRLIAYIDAPI